MYSTGLSNSCLDLRSIALWIWNAILYAILICLVYFIAVAPSFKSYGLYEMGSLIYFGMVLALHGKAIFLHHRWAYVIPTVSMIISVGGLLLFCFILSETLIIASPNEYDYYFVQSWLYEDGLFWFFGIFSVPIFCFLLDLSGHSLYILFWPTKEILFREVEMKVICKYLCV